MTKGRKTGGRNFVKGDPRAGRPKTPEDVARSASLTMAEARAALSRYIKFSMNELEEAMRSKTIPALDVWIARIVLLGIKHGDQQRLNFMFDRLIGKVTEKVDHYVKAEPQDDLLSEVPTEVVIKIIRQREEERKAKDGTGHRLDS